MTTSGPESIISALLTITDDISTFNLRSLQHIIPTPHHHIPIMVGDHLSSYFPFSMFSQNEVSATLGYALSHVRQVLRRQFPTMDYNCIDDAVATAIELFIRKAPAHLRQSKAGAFCWIRTTATNELRRMAHAARRFIHPSDAVSFFDIISSDEPVDYKAHARVLFDWLVTILGVAAAETVWLHDVERWTPRDIASAKQINIAAVKARISRSRRILRHFMASSR